MSSCCDPRLVGVCLLTLLAPRDLDEYECDRMPFYPFARADGEDDEFALFMAAATAAPPPMPPSHSPLGRPLGSPAGHRPPATPPPGLGFLAPSALCSPPQPAGLVGPPGLMAMPPTTSSLATAADEYSSVRSFLGRRADLYGMGTPEPALSPAVLRLLDTLLSMRASARLVAADAADILCAQPEDLMGERSWIDE